MLQWAEKNIEIDKSGVVTMKNISEKDREILRKIAHRKAELANNSFNDELMKKWKALGECKRENPTVRLLFYNFRKEIINPQMQCEGEVARALENELLGSIAGRELFADDTPLQAVFDIANPVYCNPYGLEAKRQNSSDERSNGYHIEAVIEDLEEEIDKLRGGSFGAYEGGASEKIELATDLFGDILPVRRTMGSLGGTMTAKLVNYMGMEQYYVSMYDCPEKVHEAMEMATRIYEQFYDFLEEKKLLLPCIDTSNVAQESFAFNNILPTENVTKTNQCWGFLESQETTAVSAEMFGEFVFPYQDRLAKRYGLLSYGCCERVDAIWEDYLSKWKNLRKLSVSPFNNEKRVGDYLRGTNVVYYSKPRAEYLTMRNGIDEVALREYFKNLAINASGCLFEVAQREVGTIYGDVERGRRYVQIAKEEIEKHWKP